MFKKMNQTEKQHPSTCQKQLSLFHWGILLRVPVTFDGRVRLSQSGLGETPSLQGGKENWDATTKGFPPTLHLNRDVTQDKK